MGEDESLEKKALTPEYQKIDEKCVANRKREVTGGLVSEKDFRLYELKEMLPYCRICINHHPFADGHYCHIDKEEQKPEGEQNGR